MVVVTTASHSPAELLTPQDKFLLETKSGNLHNLTWKIKTTVTGRNFHARQKVEISITRNKKTSAKNVV